MRVLGVDPGTLKMGYGLIESDNGKLSMLDCGVLTASSKLHPTNRLHVLYRKLKEIVDHHQPDEVAIEEPFVARNVRSALAIGRAQALAILAATDNGIPIYTYAPTKVKLAVTNYGVSGKEQVQQMVQIHLELPQIPRHSDAADALAVALCHIQERHVARLMVKGE